jgi:hypothetical protein
MATLILLIALVAIPSRTASAADDPVRGEAAATRPAVPKCPRGYRAVARRWRGWYGCRLKRGWTGRRWVRPKRCRAGYELWVRKAPGGLRAWRCKRVTAPSPPPPPTPPPPPPPPPPQKPPQRSLADWAYSFALADAQSRISIVDNPKNWTVYERFVQNCREANGVGQCDVWVKVWRSDCNPYADPWCQPPDEIVEWAWYRYTVAAVPTVLGIVSRTYDFPYISPPYSYICSDWGYAGVPTCS